MPIDFDFTGTSESDLEGRELVEPGRYHVRVDKVDDTFESWPNSIAVDLEILSGTVPDQAGLFHREFLSVSPKAQKRVAKFAIATGVMSKADLNKLVKLDLQVAIGRELIVNLDTKTYDDRNGVQREGRSIGFLDFFAVGSPEADGVPLADTGGNNSSPSEGSGGFADI